MESLKSFTPWLFRISILIHGVLYNWANVKDFGFDKGFFISLLWLACSIGIFVGGFLKTASTTVISSFGLVILSFFYILTDFNGDFNLTLSTQLLVLSIAFYFLTYGGRS